ncbi:hypothetical protein [Paenibacillus tundrae]|uniref:Uncharacterized protein n=1 Tax=Paenibacillus tundrae TaxID=528187 RepID=A0ABT9W7D2_9BACL|nr:hypothetical protein [Paenibacillus tundrae]MDQ0169161.1 hypothetical protein [Paenibacillus tundrae]
MKSINDVKRKLAMTRTRYPAMLMDKLEDSYIENDQLRKELQQVHAYRKSLVRLMREVTDILNLKGKSYSQDLALERIYRWLHENKPAEQEGEAAHE